VDSQFVPDGSVGVGRYDERDLVVSAGHASLLSCLFHPGVSGNVLRSDAGIPAHGCFGVDLSLRVRYRDVLPRHLCPVSGLCGMWGTTRHASILQ